jgi:hypothetical protein
MTNGSTEQTAAPLFALYARKTARSKGRLIALMFDDQAAQRHARELRAAMDYVSVEVRQFSPGAVPPDSIA